MKSHRQPTRSLHTPCAKTQSPAASLVPAQAVASAVSTHAVPASLVVPVQVGGWLKPGIPHVARAGMQGVLSAIAGGGGGGGGAPFTGIAVHSADVLQLVGLAMG